MRIDLAMPDPARTAAAELKALLEARGVRVTGGMRVQHGAPPQTTAAGEPILTPMDPASQPFKLDGAGRASFAAADRNRPRDQQSQPESARGTVSANRGREKLGVGSTAAGLKVEKDFLKAAGVADGDVILSDGSGLSRDDLVTPRAVVRCWAMWRGNRGERRFFPRCRSPASTARSKIG